MLKADFLQDAFHMSGNNEEAFEELLQEIDAHTCYHPVAMKNLVVFSRVEEAYQKNAPDECTVYAFWPGNPWVKGPGSKAPVIRFETVKVLPNVTSNKEYDAKLYAEMISSNSMMLSVMVNGKGSVYHVSTLAIPTLAQRLGVTTAAIGTRSFASDCLIAEQLNQDKEVKLVVKNYRRTGKICAVMSPKYAEIPLHDICTIYRDLFGENPNITKISDTTTLPSDRKNVTCDGWDVTHERVRINFAFHGYAEDINAMYNIKDKLIPCLELVTSDIGENAFEATGYWKTPNGAKIYGSSFKREHRGTATCKAATGAAKGKHDTIRDIIRQGVEENIFDKYTKLPERLLELLQIDITPQDLNLTKARGRGRNAKAVVAAFQYVFRELHLSQILSAKRIRSIFENCIEHGQIDESMRYTAYDIAMKTFELELSLKPWLEKEGVCKETIRKFSEAVGKAAYVNFEKLADGKTGNTVSEAFIVPQTMEN